MQTQLKKPVKISDLQFLKSFESKAESKEFAQSLKKQYDIVRTQKVILYKKTKTFYRIYVGFNSFY
jgi:hypothetical protein